MAKTIKSSQHIEVLDLLRFPLTLFVVLGHLFCSYTFTVHGIVYSWADYNIYTSFVKFIGSFLEGKSVPFFFFISGFLFFYKTSFDKETYIHKMKRRIHSLLIPYILWNTAAILFEIFLRYCPLLPNATPDDIHFTVPGLLSCYWNGRPGIFLKAAGEMPATAFPFNGVLWFVRDLIIVSLLTPFLYRTITRWKSYSVYLLGIAWFIINSISLPLEEVAVKCPDFLHVKMLITAFFFFSWGAYFSMMKIDLKQVWSKYFSISAVVYVLFSMMDLWTAVYHAQYHLIFKNISTIASLPFFYNIANWLLEKKGCHPNKFLTESVFFVYATHNVINSKILLFWFKIIKPASEWGCLSIYFLTLALSFTLILGAYWILKRCGFTKLLNGR